MTDASTRVYARDGHWILTSYWKEPAGFWSLRRGAVVIPQTEPAEVLGTAVLEQLERSRNAPPDLADQESHKAMLASLKIRSQRQFLIGNQSVSVSDRDDIGLVVTPYRADLSSKAFFPINELAHTATDRTPTGIGQLVIEQLDKAQAPAPRP